VDDLLNVETKGHLPHTDARRCAAWRRTAGNRCAADLQRVNVTLDAETLAKAAAIGGGNLSLGIRWAIRKYRGKVKP
jgi:hypothetical protein